MNRSKILPPPRELIAIATFAMLVVVIMPWMHATGAIAGHKLELYGKYLCYASLAVSLNLLWGYTGLLCLGQCLFFALGGYAFGMHLMLKIGVDSVYKSPLPDFMDFQGYNKLPLHWVPFDSFTFAAAATVCVPAIVALIFGFLVFRSRITGVYFAIITQALTYAAWILFLRNEFTFGGNNGFTKFNTVLGAPINDPSTERWLFILSALLLVAVVLLCSVLTRTRFGKIQKAIRDSENRVRFSGYCTEHFKLYIFTLSAAIAGVAGALYVPQAGIINPDVMKPVESLEVVVWVAVGGRATVWGPVLGALSVNILKSWATVAFPDYWLIILGGVFLLVVLFLPGGLTSLVAKMIEVKNRRFPSSSPPPAVETTETVNAS